MIILGIHDGHNASAALLKNGRIIGAVQEERFTRIKNHYTFPELSVHYLLSSNDIEMNDVNHVILCNYHTAKSHNREQLKKKYKESENFLTKLKYSVYYNTPIGKIYRKNIRKSRIDKLIQLGFRKNQISFEEHHLLHASSAYYSWGNFKEKVLILTADGQGDMLCGTINIGENGEIERIANVKQSNSFGSMYAMITYLMGMVPLEHEYKVMGLAPYGSERTQLEGKKLFEDLFYIEKDEIIFRRNKILPPAQHGYKSYRKYLEGIRFDIIAAGAQYLVENIMVKWVKNCMKKTGITNVALSGGLAMNVKANKKIMEIQKLTKFFIMPSAGDESNPIGAVYNKFIKEGGDLNKIKPLKDLYLGPSYNDEEIINDLDEKKYTITKKMNLTKVVAKMIADGEVIALCRGKTEFGARALGNRSIVANPSKMENVKIINDMIKHRDFWMPFAPSILSESEKKYIINPKNIAAPYMILSFESTNNCEEIIGGTHTYDKTVRPQIVYKNWNPKYHNLINSFKDETGIGAVLNTSFNLHGHPIVNRPKDAMFVMENSGLKHLILDNYMISKN